MRKIFWAFCILAITSCGETKTAGPEVPAETVAPVIIQDRFRLYESEFTAQETLNRLLQSLDRRDLTVFSLIDHQAGAQSVDLEMPASTLVIFGNPRAGTPLIIAEPLLGAELPLRALVYEADGQVMLAITGPDYLKREYKLEVQDARFKAIKQALNTIASEATSK